GEGYYGIRDNDTPPTFPDMECGKHLNEYRITAVWLEDLNGAFHPMLPGISAANYTTVGNLGFPSRYEIRSCIEVFPRPSDDGLKLWIKGQMELDAFTS